MALIDRAFSDWYREDEVNEDEVSTLDLINSGMLVSDDTADMAIWLSLRDVSASDVNGSDVNPSDWAKSHA